MELLAELNGEGMTVIMVTHNTAHTRFAGRHLRLRDGRVVAPGADPVECATPTPGVLVEVAG